MRRVEHANEEQQLNAVTSGSPGIHITSVTSPASGASASAVESIRAPRAVQMVELIQEYADLSAGIEHLSLKPLSVRVDFNADDFPRETMQRLETIARCDRYTQALAVKDQMVLLMTFIYNYNDHHLSFIPHSCGLPWKRAIN